MNQADYIVCCRLGKASYVVPGSLTATCSQCGKLVLVSPSSLEVRDHSPNSRILCIECAISEMEKAKGEIMELTRAQVEEIEEWKKARS
jgi:hypothetical protein